MWGASGCGRFVSAAASSCPNDDIVYPGLPEHQCVPFPSRNSVQTEMPLQISCNGEASDRLGREHTYVRAKCVEGEVGGAKAL